MLRIAILAVMLTGLAACGSSTGDRALSGAGIGAGTGALVGGPVGALVGGVAGGTAGAVTDEEDVDLGEPVWR